METVKQNINKLKLPLEIKQTILSMMAFNPGEPKGPPKKGDRISSFSLFNNLRNMMNLFDEE